MRRGAGGGHELQGPPAPRNLRRTRCPDSPPAPRAVILALSWAWFPLPPLMLCPECVPLQLDCSHQIQICFLPRPSDRPLLDSLYTDRPSRQVSAQPPLSVTQHSGPMLSSADDKLPASLPALGPLPSYPHTHSCPVALTLYTLPDPTACSALRLKVRQASWACEPQPPGFPKPAPFTPP